ncbi:MAG TPA: UDP-4-amino-4,6-dideoxy-N-acetyl-beta-L-altrosamine transaminase [Rhizomicrobium sp.]|nr:UDP-4-amino-4,6-dideoxy-N-acetyl-beta-L-altrosamine transaminase [Rhizomicrobium sp.]
MPDKTAGAPALNFLPYGRQEIGDADIKAVVEALCSDWLTTGPRVGQFEKAFAQFCGAAEGVAVNSGTAALHAAMRALQVGAGDEVIVPAITFAASANAAIYEGATPVFADVDADTLLIDPARVAALVTPRTKAIVAVDYAGQPADYDALQAIVKGKDIKIVADACHAPGATYKGRMVGTLADISCFSFHPVKHLTTCEGGMTLTADAALAAHMRRFRNHGIDSDHRKRESEGTFAYDMVELGYNYRLPDVQCALGLAQLERLPQWVAKRREVAEWYSESLADIAHVAPLRVHADRTHAYHLYVARLDLTKLRITRARAFAHLRERGIGANVHYAPVYLHSFYRARGYAPGLCPVAEAVYEQILTLPMFPAMSRADVARVSDVLAELAALS